jgi:hypothetical protein
MSRIIPGKTLSLRANLLRASAAFLRCPDEVFVHGLPELRLRQERIEWFRDIAHRNEGMPNIISNSNSKDVFSHAPEKAASYWRIGVKFAD